MTAEMQALIIVTDRPALCSALALLARNEACGVVYIDDRPGGGVQIQCWVASGYDAEARLADLYAMVQRVANAGGAVLVDAARLVARGAA